MTAGTSLPGDQSPIGNSLHGESLPIVSSHVHRSPAVSVLHLSSEGQEEEDETPHGKTWPSQPSSCYSHNMSATFFPDPTAQEDPLELIFNKLTAMQTQIHHLLTAVSLLKSKSSLVKGCLAAVQHDGRGFPSPPNHEESAICCPLLFGRSFHHSNNTSGYAISFHCHFNNVSGCTISL